MAFIHASLVGGIKVQVSDAGGGSEDETFEFWDSAKKPSFKHSHTDNTHSPSLTDSHTPAIQASRLHIAASLIAKGEW